MINTTFLQAIEQSWSKIGDAYHSTMRRLDDRSKIVLEIVTPEHLALIEGWEHASCLDITVMDIHSRTSRILSAGPCVTRDEIGERLGQLVGFLARGKNDAQLVSQHGRAKSGAPVTFTLGSANATT